MNSIRQLVTLVNARRIPSALERLAIRRTTTNPVATAILMERLRVNLLLGIGGILVGSLFVTQEFLSPPLHPGLLGNISVIGMFVAVILACAGITELLIFFLNRPEKREREDAHDFARNAILFLEWCRACGLKDVAGHETTQLKRDAQAILSWQASFVHDHKFAASVAQNLCDTTWEQSVASDYMNVFTDRHNVLVGFKIADAKWEGYFERGRQISAARRTKQAKTEPAVALPPVGANYDEKH